MNNEASRIRATVDVMRTQSFLDAVKAADVVMTYPTSPEWNSQIAYGKKRLEEIAERGSEEPGVIMELIVDWQTDEIEHLCAILLEVKGKCDLP